MTAMHCPNALRYNNATGIIQYRNAASTTSTGNHIDLQWHSVLSGSSVSSTFQNSSSTEVTATGAQNAVVNGSVCHYGLGSAVRRCGTIYSLGVCYTDDLTFCGLAQTSTYISTGGDSGGPWFTNSTVLTGVHSGVTVVSGVARSVYTPQTRIAENLGGTVLTD
ncbi:MAG: hypothetical protein QM622_03270 [Microbacterium sp.]